jgi:hypothetical protein
MTNGTTNFIKNNLGTIGAGIGGAAFGGTVGYIAGRKASNKRKRKKAKRKNWKSRYKIRKARKQKQPRTAGKRKDTSTRRIRYTKNNQPYVILANGRARFISKKSAKTSRKRKSGRY